MEEAAERKLQLTYFANSYSAFFKSDDISHELSRLQGYIEETLVKLEELQSLFFMKESEDAEWIETVVSSVLNQNREAIDLFIQRLDYLDDIVQSYKRVFDELESQIALAEQAFGLTSSFRNMLSLFKRPTDPAAMVHSLESSKFVPVVSVDIETRFHQF